MRSVSAIVSVPVATNMTRAALHGGERLGSHSCALKIAAAGGSNHPAPFFVEIGLEHFLAASQHVVQGILEVRGRLGELLPNLLDVLLVTFLNLFAE